MAATYMIITYIDILYVHDTFTYIYVIDKVYKYQQN